MPKKQKKLLVLESPTKARTIRNYLGPEFETIATEGHIMDLKRTGRFGFGIDLETFEPSWARLKTRQRIIEQIQKRSLDVEIVLIATDPDREGEAIASHIQSIIPKVKTSRIIFRELTKRVVQEAIQNPREIDSNLVNSQIARRALDRIFGFRLSSLLRSRFQAVSAGRVQSFALRLIVDREEEIRRFVPEVSWSFSALTKDENVLMVVPARGSANLELRDEAESNKFQKTLEINSELELLQIDATPFVIAPPTPFKTSTLISGAATRLGISAKQTLYLAQRLYEGVKIDGEEQIGLITYMRTDSTRMSPDFIAPAREYIAKRFGSEYLGGDAPAPKKKKTRVKIQDAHEAIRITNPELTPESLQQKLEPKLYSLYRLIYERTLSTLMAPISGHRYSFFFVPKKIGSDSSWWCLFSRRVLDFPGFGRLAGTPEDLLTSKKLLPAWKEGTTIQIAEWKTTRKETKPPARFRDASLVRRLDHYGVGRPSTYGQTLARLEASLYVERQNGSFSATKKGEEVISLFREHFARLIDEEYTAGMEHSLDEIATGKEKRTTFLASFWKRFNSDVEAVENRIERPKAVILEDRCPRCNTNLIERKGRFGPFVGCNGYPKCRYIRPDASRIVPDRSCPDCESKLIRRDGKRGEFISCSAYPDCRYIDGKAGDKDNKKAPKSTGRSCPQSGCDGDLVERMSRWKAVFVACSAFPKCRFIETKSKKKKEPKK